MMKHKHTQDTRDYQSHQKKQQWEKVKGYAKVLNVSNLDAYANIRLLDRYENEGRVIDKRIISNPDWKIHKGTGYNKKKLGKAKEEIANMDLSLSIPALRKIIHSESIEIEMETEITIIDVRKLIDMIEICRSKEEAIKIFKLGLRVLDGD